MRRTGGLSQLVPWRETRVFGDDSADITASAAPTTKISLTGLRPPLGDLWARASTGRASRSRRSRRGLAGDHRNLAPVPSAHPCLSHPVHRPTIFTAANRADEAVRLAPLDEMPCAGFLVRGPRRVLPARFWGDLLTGEQHRKTRFVATPFHHMLERRTEAVSLSRGFGDRRLSCAHSAEFMCAKKNATPQGRGCIRSCTPVSGGFGALAPTDHGEGPEPGHKQRRGRRQRHRRRRCPQSEAIALIARGMDGKVHVQIRQILDILGDQT